MKTEKMINERARERKEHEQRKNNKYIKYD